MLKALKGSSPVVLITRMVVAASVVFAFALERSGAFFQLPSFPVSQRDIKGAVGAGDAFAAGFLYALNERQRIEDALRLAHATAAISLTVADAVGAIRSLRNLLTRRLQANRGLVRAYEISGLTIAEFRRFYRHRLCSTS